MFLSLSHFTSQKPKLRTAVTVKRTMRKMPHLFTRYIEQITRFLKRARYSVRNP